MASDPKRVQAVFLEAVALPAADRLAVLDRACGADVELRQRVQALLLAHEEPGSFLEQPAVDARATGPEAPHPVEGPGVRIGPYKLLEPIGEGGMGTVWMAEQQEPVRRLVALKVIKAGLDSAQVVARFEAERQALALMDHPHIAKVFDGGTTENGRPYFVMELVKGVPITKYCDEHRLTPRQRLELFVPVCQAVQHAHQKGVIHRDLKPSNVLVAAYDGRLVPKVIDFGVAKATGQKLTERTLVTGFGHLVGTLEYMSPEQAEFNALDIDTRSDIYALGVLLYELLTGTTPLTKQRLKEAALAEVLRVIREDEPPKPSTRLSASKDSLAAVSKQRHMEPAQLTKQVRGELDWIVMKALEKDRGRRYETANGFARDIERYLADEPVQAGPPSAWYRLRKFARRNKGPVIAGSVILLSLVAGIFGTTGGLVWAMREREAKEQARQEIEQAYEILASIFRDLDPMAEEEGGWALRVQLGKHLDQTANLLQGEALGDPITAARLQDRLGSTLRELGQLDRAQPLLEKARQTRETVLGPNHADTLQSKTNLAVLYHYQRKYDLAEPLFLEVLQVRTAKLIADHPDTLTSKNNLASLYLAQRKYDLAEALFQEVLQARTTKLGADHPETLNSKHELAVLYRDQRKFDRAEPLFREVLQVATAKLGVEHVITLTSKNNLAGLYHDQRKYAQAEPLYEEVLQARTARLGADHPATLTTKNNLGLVYQDQKKYDQAEPLFQGVLQVRTAKLPADHPDTLTSKNNLARLYLARKQYDLAEPLFREAVEGRRRRLGLDHPNTQNAIRNLSICYERMGQPDRAEPLRRELAGFWKQRAGAEPLRYAEQLVELGSNLLAQNKHAEAEPVLRECLAIQDKKEPDAWTTFHTRVDLGGSLLSQKKYAEAEPLLVQGYQGLKEREAKIPANARVRLTEAVQRLVQFYDAWGKPDEAAKWRSELEARKKK